MKINELLRFIWRQLTSMRTALFLLLLLAIASVPGSLLPQRGENPVAVDNFILRHQYLGKLLDSLKFFDVFASVWFSATYILLFISMIGCVIPRTFQHLKLVFKAPPDAPKFLDKMDAYSAIESNNQAEALEVALKWFKSKRYRVKIKDQEISAEKGYLRESGNLLFHLSLIILLLGIACGSLFSTNGEVILNIGDRFLNTPTSYDSISYGRLQSPAGLPPFALTIKDFHATYNPVNNAPSDYKLQVIAQNPFNGPGKPVTIKVNSPLTYGATKIYLQANGYSPIVTVRDLNNKIIFSGPTIFLPQDANLTSSGAIKLPDANPQIGFAGTYVPTFSQRFGQAISSAYPESLDPRLLLGVWKGPLGLDSGIPQSVYKLDTSRMVRLGTVALKIGESYNYGFGTVTFNGYTQWVNLQIVHDPGKNLALLGALIALLGLIFSLLGRQRRIWIKFGEVIEIAGLAKTRVSDLEVEIKELLSRINP